MLGGQGGGTSGYTLKRGGLGDHEASSSNMYFQQPTYKDQTLIDTKAQSKSNATEENDNQSNSETDSEDLKA